MIWVILCKDKKYSYKKRMEVIDEHRKYLSTKPIKTLLSGPLTDISGIKMNGSFFMVEASSEDETVIFQKNDQIYTKSTAVFEIFKTAVFKRIDNLSS